MKTYKKKLGDILTIKDLPENISGINLKPFIRITDDTESKKVWDLFRLCYYQSMMDLPGMSMSHRLEIYGKLFLDHHKIKRDISDEFENNSQVINDKINDLRKSAKLKLDQIKAGLEEKKIIVPTTKEELNKIYVERDLTEFDKKNKLIPGLYSSLLLSLIDKNGDPKPFYTFNDYKPTTWHFKSLVEESMLQGHLLILLLKIIDDFEQQMNSSGEYNARTTVKNMPDAAIHFLTTYSDHKSLTYSDHESFSSGQAAYLIRLKYQYTKGKEVKKWDKSDQNSLSSNIRKFW